MDYKDLLPDYAISQFWGRYSSKFNRYLQDTFCALCSIIGSVNSVVVKAYKPFPIRSPYPLFACTQSADYHCHLGYQKCRILDSIPNFLNQNLLPRFPEYSCGHEILRILPVSLRTQAVANQCMTFLEQQELAQKWVCFQGDAGKGSSFLYRESQRKEQSLSPNSVCCVVQVHFIPETAAA